MVRMFQQEDLEQVLQIWLRANLQAHSFIPRSYWEGHLEQVRQLLPKAELWVMLQDDVICGFIGLTGSMIAGIFAAPEHQSRGIGKALLDHVKMRKPMLTLQVYQKNERAYRFYLREDFFVTAQQTDEETGEPEYQMQWNRTLPD